LAKQIDQTILPAVRNLKEFDELMETCYERIILLHAHVAKVKPLVVEIIVRHDIISSISHKRPEERCVSKTSIPIGQ
jgi:glycerol-3-phosphate responsive antiterminator